MAQPGCALEDAVEAWLRAYEGYKNYLPASENLYEAFARSWQGSRRSLAEAFDAFRQSVGQGHDRKPLEVNPVNPNKHSRIE